VLQSNLVEFLSDENAPLSNSFPEHCHHRLDSISLLTMGVTDQQVSHIFQILAVEKTKDFNLSALAPLKPPQFRCAENRGFIHSFMLWSTMKFLITSHAQSCDPNMNSANEYIEGSFSARVLEDIPINEMELSVRSKNVLQREGFITASQLALFTREDLLNFEHIGINSVNEIESQLILLGIWEAESKKSNAPKIQLAFTSSTNLSIEELGLSSRTLNGLKRHGYLDLATLLLSNNDDIRDIRNFGAKSIDEVLQIKSKYADSVTSRSGKNNLPGPLIEDVFTKTRNLILDDIEKCAAQIETAGNLLINQKTLTHFNFAVASRLSRLIENGGKTILEVLGEVRTELTGTDFVMKLESELLFLDKLFEGIDLNRDLRDSIYPSKSITSSLFNYENQYSDDTVDILEFDDATYFLLGFDSSQSRNMLEQEGFFAFLDVLDTTLICSRVPWDALRRIIEFHLEHKTFPNLLGLTVASFAHNPNNSESAIKELKRYLSHVKPLSAERDFSIIQLRIEGNTLDKIGKVNSLTRERVRQILNKYSPHLNALTDAIHDEKNNKEAMQFNNSVVELFQLKGAVYKDEIAAVLNLGFDEAYRVLPKKFRKFIIDLSKETTITSKWSREIVLELLKKASTYYFPLKISDYEHLVEIGEIDGPSVPKIWLLFGSWGEACRIAGVESAPALRHEYSKMWSDEELVSFVVRYLKAEDTTGTFDGYRAWRESQMDHVPSEALLRNTFESWTNAKRQALEIIRIEKGHEVRT